MFYFALSILLDTQRPGVTSRDDNANKSSIFNCVFSTVNRVDYQSIAAILFFQWINKKTKRFLKTRVFPCDGRNNRHSCKRTRC